MPLHKTMMTYAVLWTVADVVEQKFISKKMKHDPNKTVRIATVGTFVIAPLVFYWIRLAEKMFPGKQLKTVITKVVAEQVMFAPVSISCFYKATTVLEGKNFQEEMKTKYFKTWKTGLAFWPFVQTFNFGVVTPMYRPFVVAGASFCWSIFLCFMKEDKKKEKLSNQEIQYENSNVQVLDKSS